MNTIYMQKCRKIVNRGVYIVNDVSIGCLNLIVPHIVYMAGDVFTLQRDYNFGLYSLWAILKCLIWNWQRSFWTERQEMRSLLLTEKCQNQKTVLEKNASRAKQEHHTELGGWFHTILWLNGTGRDPFMENDCWPWDCSFRSILNRTSRFFLVCYPSEGRCVNEALLLHMYWCVNHPGKGFPGGMCNRVNPTCNGKFDVDTTKVCDALLKQIKDGEVFWHQSLKLLPLFFFSLMETFALVD